MESKDKKVFVGLSGGVDSSVAALLLKNEGYNVVGIHLRCWNKDGCDVPEAEDARKVADKLGIPYYVLDMEKEYKERVVDYMIEGYKKGITPNPDVMCNREIKFGLFLEKALSMGGDFVATGHYARKREETRDPEAEQARYGAGKGQGTRYELWAAKDKNKDQSYFLWALTQDQLEHVMFPLGELTKEEVRKVAKEAGLPTAEKKDSQGICFIGEVTLKDFLEEYLPKRRGNVRTPSGEILGTHDGAHFYTVGQRHGLGISGDDPYYVAGKDMETNTVVLATRDDETLKQGEIEITDINLINKNIPEDVLIRVRYRQLLQKAKVKMQNKNIRVIFESPQEFITPGQSAVLYSNEGELFGGGVIL